jgi:uncharacterized membrane protein
MSSQPGFSALGRAEASSDVAGWVAVQRWTLAVYGATAVWAVALFATVRDDFVHFRLGRFDFGNMVQAVWSTAHGRPLEATDIAGNEITRLGSHVDPVLALLAPLWAIAPSPLTLTAVNVLAISLGALPVFWLGRRHLGSERAAALMAIAYLLYPWTGWAARDALHPVTLAIPLLLFCVWFLDTESLRAFVPCAILAVLTGELVGITIAALGIWFAVARARPRAGLTIAVAAASWSVLAVYVVIPAFADGPSPFYGYYASVGGSPQGVVRTALAHPGDIASALFTQRDAVYLMWLVAPLAGMFMLAPGLAAVALPQLLAAALSDSPGMTNPRDHYVATAIPFLIAATAVGLGRVSVVRRSAFASVVLGLCLGFSLLAGPWPGAPGNLRSRQSLGMNHEAALRAGLALVPDDAPVTSTTRAGLLLSERRYVYSVPVLRRSQWVVLETSDPFVANMGFPVLEKNPETLSAFRQRIEASARWTKVFDRNGVFVFRRFARG